MVKMKTGSGMDVASSLSSEQKNLLLLAIA